MSMGIKGAYNTYNAAEYNNLAVKNAKNPAQMKKRTEDRFEYSNPDEPAEMQKDAVQSVRTQEEQTELTGQEDQTVQKEQTEQPEQTELTEQEEQIGQEEETEQEDKTEQDKGDGDQYGSSGKVGINAGKLARMLAAAKTRSQVQAVMAKIQADLNECEAGKNNGMDVDEASVKAAEQLMQQAKSRMGSAENRDATPEEEMAAALASIM